MAFSGLISACGSGSTPLTSAKPASTSDFTAAHINWKKFAGTSLTFAASANPWVTAIQSQIPTFQQLTGIKLNVQVLGENEFVTKLPLTLTAHSKTPEIFMVDQPGQAVGARWLAPLGTFMSDSSLTDLSWYDPGDFFKGAQTFATANGTQWLMPITAEVQVLFARSDLVHSAPRTFSDLAHVAAQVQAKNRQVAGIGMRASADPSETPWSFGGFVFSYGGDFIDRSGKPAFASPAAVAAMDSYTSLLRQSGPKGVTSWGWLQCQQAMQQGEIAMWADSSSFASTVLDPSQARYAKQTVVYPLPAQAGASKPNVWYWTVGINNKADIRQQQAAWLFLQWATSKPTYDAIAAGTGTAPRGSAWNSPKVTSKLGPTVTSTIHSALSSADSQPMAMAWDNPKWSQVASYVAQAVNSVVAGSSGAAAAARSLQSSATSVLA
jgi:multiple sugar transport system substrate-binding protein